MAINTEAFIQSAAMQMKARMHLESKAEGEWH